MDTYLTLEYGHEQPLPEGHTSEVRAPEVLVERFVRALSEPGDRVFDPFAGYGTTLVVAERLDRDPHGVEFEADRVAHARERLDDPDRIRQGDVLDLDPSTVPDCDLCFTSPPFMTRSGDHDPFQNYGGQSTYEEYLENVERAFARVRSVLRPGGRVAVDVVNLKRDGEVTTLAWDIADRVAGQFAFDGEVVITWERDERPPDGRLGYGYDHSYCMLFTRE